MSVKVTDLAKELLPWTPGCPGPMARRELVRAAQRFCRATEVITSESGLFTLRATEGELSLDGYAMPSTQAIRAVQVAVAGKQLRQVLLRAVQQRDGDPTEAKAEDTQAYYMLDEKTLRVWPYPSTDREMSMTVAVAPTDRATTLPDALGAQWRDAVIGGAMQVICSIPGQAYTSQDHAAMGAGRFAAGVNLAKIEVNRSFGVDLRVTPRPFA